MNDVEPGRTRGVARRRDALRRTALAGAAAGPAWLAACGLPGTAAPTKASAVGGTVDFVYQASDATDKAMQDQFAAFRQRYPQIDLRLTNAPGNLPDKLVTLMTGGAPADMFYLPGTNFARFYALHAMAPLEPLLKRDKVDLSDYYAGSLEPYQWGGKQYGIVADYGYRVLFYNANLFQKAGIPLPPGEWNATTWTFDDCTKAAQALTNRDTATPQWGLVNPQTSPNWQIWIYANGGRVIGPTHDEVWITRPEAIEALQNLADLRVKYGAGQTSQEASQISEMDAFFNGRAALWPNPSGTVTPARSITGFTWDVAPIPRGPKATGTRKTFGGGSAWHIGAQSKAPDAAWAVYQTVISKEMVSAWAGAGQPPGHKSVANSPVWVDPSKPPKNKRVLLDGYEGIVPFPKLTTWVEFQAAANQELAALWNGTKSAVDAASAIKTVTEPLIARHKDQVGNDKP